VTKNWC